MAVTPIRPIAQSRGQNRLPGIRNPEFFPFPGILDLVPVLGIHCVDQWNQLLVIGLDVTTARRWWEIFRKIFPRWPPRVRLRASGFDAIHWKWCNRRESFIGIVHERSQWTVSKSLCKDIGGWLVTPLLSKKAKI